LLDRPAARYREAYGKGLTLIRPDGHIAWSDDASPPDAGHVIDTAAGLRS
jgi:hypothetical protein